MIYCMNFFLLLSKISNYFFTSFPIPSTAAPTPIFRPDIFTVAKQPQAHQDKWSLLLYNVTQKQNGIMEKQYGC